MEAEEQTIRELINDLQKSVLGEVLFDDLTRHLYATDASDFSKMPAGVVLPKDTDDIQAVMEITAKHGVPIIPRVWLPPWVVWRATTLLARIPSDTG